jgi:FMN reductase
MDTTATAAFPTTSPASATPVRLAVVSGGLGEPSLTARLATRLGDAAQAHLERHGLSVETDTVLLRPLAVPVAQAHVGPARDPRLESALESVLAAHAVVATVPTYKGAAAGLAHAFWELVEDGALHGVPALLGATGGTARHSLAIDTSLRPLFAQLGALTLPRGVFAATDDWGGGPASADGTAALDRRIDAAGRALAEAVLRTRALAGGLPAGAAGPADAGAEGEAPPPSITPFDAILGRR